MKFVVTFLLIAMAWVLLSLLARRGRERREDVTDARPRTNQKTAEVEQMVPCPVCGTYRPVDDKTPCDREDCPYGEGGGASV